MRTIAASIPLLVLVLLAQIASTAALQEGHEIRFYIYGAPTCPHCNRLKEILIQAYGEEAVVFNDVTVRENGEKLIALYKLVYPEVELPAVPLTIVVVDGSPAASAVGEAEPEFWEFLIEKHLELGKFLRVDFEGNVQVTDRDQQLRMGIAGIIGLASSTTTVTTTVSRDLSYNGDAPTLTQTTAHTIINDNFRNGYSGDVLTLLLTGFGSTIIFCVIVVAYLRLRRRQRYSKGGRGGR